MNGWRTTFSLSREEFFRVIGSYCEKHGHFHQVVYSTYGNALTQICFTCGRIRTTMRHEDYLLVRDATEKLPDDAQESQEAPRIRSMRTATKEESERELATAMELAKQFETRSYSELKKSWGEGLVRDTLAEENPELRLLGIIFSGCELIADSITTALGARYADCSALRDHEKSPSAVSEEA